MILTENRLRLAAIAISVIGLASLAIIEHATQPVAPKISEINSSFEGKKAIITGKAQNAFVKKNTLFFELHEKSAIKAVKFNPSEEDIFLARKNGFIQASGRIQKFREELEIVVEKMEELKQVEEFA